MHLQAPGCPPVSSLTIHIHTHTHRERHTYLSTHTAHLTCHASSPLCPLPPPPATPGACQMRTCGRGGWMLHLSITYIHTSAQWYANTARDAWTCLLCPSRRPLCCFARCLARRAEGRVHMHTGGRGARMAVRRRRMRTLTRWLLACRSCWTDAWRGLMQRHRHTGLHGAVSPQRSRSEAARRAGRLTERDTQLLLSPLGLSASGAPAPSVPLSNGGCVCGEISLDERHRQAGSR
jgi:hypothetical protein